MFIRKTYKKKQGAKKKYPEYRLVRNRRVGDKVRQDTIITMKEVKVPKRLWGDLPVVIEAKLQGQELININPRNRLLL